MTGAIISGNLGLLLLVQGTACITVGLVASCLLRHRPARAHQALLTALLASVLTPGAYVLVKHLGLGALTPRPMLQTQERSMGNLLPVGTSTDSAEPQTPHGQAALQSATPAQEADQTRPSYVSLITEAAGAPASLSTVDPVTMAPAHDAAATRVPWGMVAAVCWIATSTLLLTRLTLRFLLGLQLLKTARPLESEQLHRAVEAARVRLGIPGPVRIRCSERIRSPVIWCWAREPVLLVHEEAGLQEDNADWVGIFCHEFAHRRRLDHLSGLLAEVLTALFPWHPLLWWAKDRLVRLGEQACDDWVIAAGQIGVDYAESLLDLSPQRQMAILPTVVGKEKAMKERIRRIVKDRCGNPTVGLRWAAAVSVLAVLAVVGVAIAQRRPAPPEPRQLEGRGEIREPREREETRERVMAGRRKVLDRMLDELAGRIREKETVLRERGDELGEERPVIEFELELLREQAEQIERRLQNLEQPGRVRPEPPDGGRRTRIPPEQRRERGEALRPGPAPEELEAQLENLRRHREELGQEAGRIERELQGLREGQDEEARELRARLQELHSAMGNVERQMAELQRARAEVERVRAMEGSERMRAEGGRAREAAGQIQDLTRRRRDLQVRLREIQGQLEERPDQDSEDARALRQERDRIQEEIAATERELENAQRARATFERDRPGREPGTPGTGPQRPGPEPSPALGREVDELRNQMQELREQMQQMRALLEQSLQRR